MWLEIIKAGQKVPVGIPQISDREVDRQTDPPIDLVHEH